MPSLDRYEQWRFMNTLFLCISYLGFALTTRGNSSIAKMKMGIKRGFLLLGYFFLEPSFIQYCRSRRCFAFVEFPGNNLFRKRLERVFSIKKSYGLSCTFDPANWMQGVFAFFPPSLKTCLPNCKLLSLLLRAIQQFHLAPPTARNTHLRTIISCRNARKCLGTAIK